MKRMAKLIFEHKNHGFQASEGQSLSMAKYNFNHYYVNNYHLK